MMQSYPGDEVHCVHAMKGGTRICVGIYQEPIMTGGLSNHLRAHLGGGNPVTEVLRDGYEITRSETPFETIVNEHPIHTFGELDTVLSLDVQWMWRGQWQDVLDYPDDDGVIGEREPATIDTGDRSPDINEDASFALHWVNGQDLHDPINIEGIVHGADSFEDVFRQARDEYTRYGHPPTWYWELIEYTGENKHDPDTANENNTDPFRDVIEAADEFGQQFTK